MTGDTRVVVMARPEPGGAEMVTRPIRAVEPDEALVRVVRAGICGSDLHIVRWNRWAASRYSLPTALGHEIAGEVVEVGRNVANVAVGDRVASETHLACGHCRQCRANRRHTCENLRVFSRLDRGGFAEYTTLPAALLRRIPPAMPFRFAALMEPLGIGVRAAMAADVRGAAVLVAGCGPIGLLTVAVMRAFGAFPILASDTSIARLGLARALGASGTVEAGREDLDEAVRMATDGAGVDIAVDASGNPRAIQQALGLVASGGRLLLSGLPEEPVTLDLTRHVILREVTVQGLCGRQIDETWLTMEALWRRPDFDLGPLLTHDFALSDFRQAFATAMSGGSGKVSFAIRPEGEP